MDKQTELKAKLAEGGMGLTEAQQLMQAIRQCNKLTFGELDDRDYFIAFPIDGDNSGHGGYKIAHNLFQKFSDDTEYNAARISRGSKSIMPDSMQVIKVNL
jgi:hypothetical protein